MILIKDKENTLTHVYKCFQPQSNQDLRNSVVYVATLARMFSIILQCKRMRMQRMQKKNQYIVVCDLTHHHEKLDGPPMRTNLDRTLKLKFCSHVLEQKRTQTEEEEPGWSPLRSNLDLTLEH